MPIVVDLMKNKIYGPLIREAQAKGIAQGKAEGKAEGIAKGMLEGERSLLLRQMRKRFGTIPHSVGEQLAAKSSEELEAVGLRLLDAQSLAELLG